VTPEAVALACSQVQQSRQHADALRLLVGQFLQEAAPGSPPLAAAADALLGRGPLAGAAQVNGGSLREAVARLEAAVSGTLRALAAATASPATSSSISGLVAEFASRASVLEAAIASERARLVEAEARSGSQHAAALGQGAALAAEAESAAALRQRAAQAQAEVAAVRVLEASVPLLSSYCPFKHLRVP